MSQEAILYAIPNSHPCRTAEKGLQLKGIPYRRVELAPIYHQLPQRLRFGRPTVPGLRLTSGEKVVGSRQILHRLDELTPEPPLLPADPAAREQVEEIERWGDEVFQDVVRRIEVRALARSEASIVVPAGAGTRMLGLPVPTFWVRLNARPGALLSARLYGASEEQVRKDLASLPGHLDGVDRSLADGLIGGEQLNVADLQLASSLRVLSTMGDLLPLIEGRPSLRLAERVFPDWPTAIPSGTLPAEWLPER
jgi:glutathione S-transferase